MWNIKIIKHQVNCNSAKNVEDINKSIFENKILKYINCKFCQSTQFDGLINHHIESIKLNSLLCCAKQFVKPFKLIDRLLSNI